MAGLLVGFVVARRISRTLVELSVPVRDAAGRLSEVVGPITLAGQEMEELPVLAQGLAAQVAAVVERLQQSQQEVLRSEQLAAVGQLAAGVAHELRNPLQSMQLLIQSAARLALQRLVAEWRPQLDTIKPRVARWSLDVDPLVF